MNGSYKRDGFGRFNTIIHLAVISLLLLAGLAIVRIFSLSIWFCLAPLGVVALWFVVTAVANNLQSYYREPTLLSGGRTRAEIDRDLKATKKEEANK